MNEQSVTTIPGIGNKVNSIRSAGLASRHSPGEARNKIRLPAQREWIATGGGPQMIGDGMLGSSSDVNQGTTVGGERIDRGQSPRSSKEASNDRGAKEGRDVVLGRSGIPSHKGPCSAARLIARMQGQNLPGTRRQPNSEPPATQVSGAQACAAGATLPKALSRVPEPVHQRPRTGFISNAFKRISRPRSPAMQMWNKFISLSRNDAVNSWGARSSRPLMSAS